MRCHLVSVTLDAAGTKVELRKLAASTTEVSVIRKEWMEKYGLKRGVVDARPIEVPTGKGQLLEFINELIDVEGV